MVNFSHLERSLMGVEAARRLRERTGKTSRGYDLWTSEDNEALKRLYPDYRAALKAFPGRTLMALKKQAAELGIVRRRHIWTGAEITRLRKLAASGASRKEMIAAFAPLREKQVTGAIEEYRLRRGRRPFKPTGHAALDVVRARCFALRLNMADLDAMARTGRYFTEQRWIRSHKVRLDYLARAIEALGGTYTITWESTS